MKRRVWFVDRLFARSRTARTVFVLAVWPFVYVADRIRGHEPASFRRGLAWARDGQGDHTPTIPTSETPAVVRRRPRGPETR